MLLGLQGAQARMQELQAKIDQLSPRPSSTFLATSGGPTFDQHLQGAIGGTAPLSPLGGGDVSVEKGELGMQADAAAAKYGLDPKIFRSLIDTESSWNPGSVSNKGAVGLTQLMPTTAAELGIDDPADPAQNLDGGARYLKQMLDQFGGDYGKALAAYNEGPGALSRSNGVPYPHETAPYVKKILSKAQAQ